MCALRFVWKCFRNFVCEFHPMICDLTASILVRSSSPILTKKFHELGICVFLELAFCANVSIIISSLMPRWRRQRVFLFHNPYSMVLFVHNFFLTSVPPLRPGFRTIQKAFAAYMCVRQWLCTKTQVYAPEFSRLSSADDKTEIDSNKETCGEKLRSLLKRGLFQMFHNSASTDWIAIFSGGQYAPLF